MSLITEKLKQLVVGLCAEIEGAEDKVSAINYVRSEIHKISPFKSEPVDFVRWIPMRALEANDYNPNRVAPPEMKLLEISINADGYTQPIVAWEKEEGKYEVVDGFHRNRVGKESLVVNQRIKGYLPISTIRTDNADKKNRIASTIRHNRARGKHTVDGMTEIVIELKKRNWSNERIGRELGMDPDEILRLCQIKGLAELFQDDEFSMAWDIESNEFDGNFDPLEDDISLYDPDETKRFRTINTDDSDRIFHHWSTWECYKSGFYETKKEGMTAHQCELAYKNFLENKQRFSETLEKVISEWKHSCEHYLTNKSFNRIAWLGQAALCYAESIPSKYRGGFNLLPKKKQDEANEIALVYLNKWLKRNGRPEVTMEEAMGHGCQMDLY